MNVIHLVQTRRRILCKKRTHIPLLCAIAGHPEAGAADWGFERVHPAAGEQCTIASSCVPVAHPVRGCCPCTEATLDSQASQLFALGLEHVCGFCVDCMPCMFCICHLYECWMRCACRAPYLPSGNAAPVSRWCLQFARNPMNMHV